LHAGSTIPHCTLLWHRSYADLVMFRIRIHVPPVKRCSFATLDALQGRSASQARGFAASDLRGGAECSLLANTCRDFGGWRDMDELIGRLVADVGVDQTAAEKAV
jgi:hypothetical protein